MTSYLRELLSVEEQLPSFHECLLQSSRVLAVCGAGLSASSGLPTFRGAGGLWRTHVSQDLATPRAFYRDPGLVWQFYSYRRHMALNVEPNPAHYALAELARRMPGFLTLTQNVDGLSPRAGHPDTSLLLLHGSLFDVKCSDRFCDYKGTNYVDPIVPALAIPRGGQDPTSIESRKGNPEQAERDEQLVELDISREDVHLPTVPLENLPPCPKCRKNILRPGVVWFGESLPEDVLGAADAYINDLESIDIVMVIGTSARVWPAAGYIDEARDRGARVCIVNMDFEDMPPGGLEEGDWFFIGDAAQIVPKLLAPVIGEVPARH